MKHFDAFTFALLGIVLLWLVFLLFAYRGCIAAPELHRMIFQATQCPVR